MAGITFGEWMEHYRQELAAHGVGVLDALAAAHLGWEIAWLHQVCFEDEVPVHFDVHPAPRYEKSSAACRFGRLGGSGAYIVFPNSLWSRIENRRLAEGSSLSIDRILRGIAAHEVRHRAQEREGLAMFVRGDLAALRGFPALFSVSVAINLQFEETERILRSGGKSEEEIAERLSPWEYDAWVITHIVFWGAEPEDDAALAALVRMNAPTVPRP